jgi:alanine-glyoxylate transaminase/serine-glyoxylate transaminase/serine-pyruvate transaminase
MNGRDPEAIRKLCHEQCNVILGYGVGELARTSFRIAHMGHTNAPMILATLATTEAAFRALDVPCGKGIDAATAAIARALKSTSA